MTSLDAVAPPSSAATPTAAMPGRSQAEAGRRAVGWWLVFMCGVLVLMIMVGGATRLTESGLSITEWRPVTGILPPLTAQGWEEELEKYRQIPEYQYVNRGMSMADFKVIYYWEWGHRLLGRLIGLLFFAGMAWFWIRGRLDGPLKVKLVALFVMGGLQGVLGWYMVQSGLVDRIDVSQYRLTAHLGLAFVILAAMAWVAFELLIGERGRPRAGARGNRMLYAVALGLLGLVFVQILMGGFVAGLRAGHIYNTWPLMEGQVIPAGLWDMSPWYMNLFESHLTAQFMHRMLAYAVTLCTAAMVWWALRRPLSAAARQSVMIVGAAVLAQVLLGIWTLLAVVPVWLGTLHQGGAALVLIAVVHMVYRLRPAVSAASERHGLATNPV